jgi:hypothetical protein
VGITFVFHDGGRRFPPYGLNLSSADTAHPGRFDAGIHLAAFLADCISSVSVSADPFRAGSPSKLPIAMRSS